MDTKKIEICKQEGKECSGNGFIAKVGNMEHNFCCEEGFKLSLGGFLRSLK